LIQSDTFKKLAREPISDYDEARGDQRLAKATRRKRLLEMSE